MNNDVMYWKIGNHSGTVDINEIYYIRFNNGLIVERFDEIGVRGHIVGIGTSISKLPLPYKVLCFIRNKAYRFDVRSSEPRLCDHSAKFYIDPLKQPLMHHYEQ